MLFSLVPKVPHNTHCITFEEFLCVNGYKISVTQRSEGTGLYFTLRKFQAGKNSYYERIYFPSSPHIFIHCWFPFYFNHTLIREGDVNLHWRVLRVCACSQNLNLYTYITGPENVVHTFNGGIKLRHSNFSVIQTRKNYTDFYFFMLINPSNREFGGLVQYSWSLVNQGNVKSE